MAESEEQRPPATTPLESQDPPTQLKQERGQWKAHEQQVIPENNMSLVFFGLLSTHFLAALDQTIVATALPTIVHDLRGGNNYSWIGSSYLLTAAAMSPVFGKLSDLVGRKPVLFGSILVFLLSSALCGAAKSMLWLIIARAVQGIGGSGIIQMVQIVIADIVKLQDRAKYGGVIGAAWGIASVIGPLIGGALTEHATWRWCFYLNLPIGGAAAFLLLFSLNLNPHKGRTFAEHMQAFDFSGLFLLIAGTVCLLVGFHQTDDGWGRATPIALITVGAVLLVLSVINELYTKRSPILPPRLFKTRTTSITLFAIFVHGYVFFAAMFYLPLWFQVLGSSPTGAGVKLLPFSLGASIQSIISGVLVTRLGDYRGVTWISWVLMCLGFGLMIMLDDATSIGVVIIVLLIAAVGLGGLFQTTLIVLQAAMPLKDLATTTASFLLVRMLGGTVGISTGQAIISSELQKRLMKLPGNTLDTSLTGALQSVGQLKHIQPASLRHQTIHAYVKSIGFIWLTDTPIIFATLLLGLFIRKYTLKTAVVKKGKKAGGADAAPPPPVLVPAQAEVRESDLEKGTPATATADSTIAEEADEQNLHDESMAMKVEEISEAR